MRQPFVTHVHIATFARSAYCYYLWSSLFRRCDITSAAQNREVTANAGQLSENEAKQQKRKEIKQKTKQKKSDNMLNWFRITVLQATRGHTSS